MADELESQVEDEAADAAEAAEPVHVEDKAAPKTFNDIKARFFGANRDPVGEDAGDGDDGEQEEAGTVDTGDDSNPARRLLRDMGKKGSEDPKVGDLLDGEVEGEEEGATTDPAPKAKAPADTSAQEFRTQDGLRYRMVGADGKVRDVLTELKGATIEVFADGAFRKVPIDKLPVVINNAVLFNKQLGQLGQMRQTLIDRESQVAGREADVERFFADPEYRAKVEKEMEELNTPEGQAKLKDQQVQEARAEIASRDSNEASTMINDQLINPALGALQEQHPLVAPEVVESMYSAAMMEFNPGDLKLVKGRDGQFQAVHPRAWQRMAAILQHELPAAIGREQARLAKLSGKEGGTPKDDVASRKSKAAAGAKVVKEELRVNRQAQRLSQTAGLRPNRDRSRPAIAGDIRKGRNWLQSHDD